MQADFDAQALNAVLGPAVATYEARTAHHSLLGRPPPDREILSPVEEAIEKCGAYRKVAGHMLYSARGGRVISSGELATSVFDRAMHDVTKAADWLLKLLTVRSADGCLKCAIWGITLSAEIRLSDSARLVPFTALTESPMKNHVTRRSVSKLFDGAVWLGTNRFRPPGAAFVMDAPNFPYIRTDNASFLAFDRLQSEALDFWVVLEAASVGYPLAFGYWFEYVDEDLDISAWENALSWTFPEIPPRIGVYVDLDAQTVQEDVRRFFALPQQFRSDLKRSMNRFVLSKCRTSLIDRVLDLALAFEIAVSGESEGNTAISWKVAVRTAQMIGGALEVRQEIRRKVNQLYQLRNRATHGGSLKAAEKHVDTEALIDECSGIYRRLLRSCFELGERPDWNSLELEPRTRV